MGRAEGAGVLRRAGRLVERALDRALRRPGRQPVLDPYFGYASPGGFVVRARVLSSLRRAAPDPAASRWANLRQMAGLFLTDEVAGVEVMAGGRRAFSDSEGYVEIMVPADGGPGWAEIEMVIAGQAEGKPCAIRVPGPKAERILISDIDDTVIRTGAHSLARNLWTTFTGSALTREVFRDSAALITLGVAAGENPVFYVSSSPWNLHAFLDRLLARDGVPRGPMFLRDLGISGGSGHGDHKGAAIDRILDAVPGLPVYLLGDTGQEDAAIYLAAAGRHPGRIAGVALREPAPGVSADDAADIAALEAAGVAVHHGETLAGAAALWGWTGQRCGPD